MSRNGACSLISVRQLHWHSGDLNICYFFVPQQKSVSSSKALHWPVTSIQVPISRRLWGSTFGDNFADSLISQLLEKKSESMHMARENTRRLHILVSADLFADIASREFPHLLDPLCQSSWKGSQLCTIKSPQALSNLQCWVSWLKRWLCCLWWAKVPHLTPPFKTSRDDHSAPRNEDISLSAGWQV